VGATTTQPCDLSQGTLTYSQEGNVELITFNECRLGEGFEPYSILNGTLYAAGTVTGVGCGYSASVRLLFAGFSSRSYTSTGILNGTLTMEGDITANGVGDETCGTRSFTMSGPAWRVGIDSVWFAYYNFDIGAYTDSNRCGVNYNARIDASTLPGSLQVTTPTPVEGDCYAAPPNDNPDEGVVRVEAAGNTSVQLTINNAGDADPNAVTLDVDLDGTTGSDPGYPANYSWDALQSL
jgi:hypothetical protein